jgi:CRISPR-associated RAMP protein (TIGR02581 family)
MLKKLVNEAYCTLQIKTTGPLLVKSGRATVSGPDMTPVLTFRNGRQEVFLPGSSLKGVFRSHIEKVVGSLKPRIVCDPFSQASKQTVPIEQRKQDFLTSCGNEIIRFTKNHSDQRHLPEEHTDAVYGLSCPTCRLFGSTGFIGRVSIGDALLASSAITEQRDGVGIDRFTGGASHGAKFELEVVSTGVTFETDIHLRNFEIWQLGMLFVVLQDMEDELIRIGSGRSRGLGKITATIREEGKGGRPGGFITSTMRTKTEPANELWGLGRWLNDGSYGTTSDDALELEPSVTREDHGIRQNRVFTGDALTNLKLAAINQFVKRMEQWPERSIYDGLVALTKSPRSA